MCSNEISNHVGYSRGQNIYFRPPYGRITRAQIKGLQQFKIIMWDVLTHDYDKSLSSEKCLAKSIAATRPGSIVVFHDSLKAGPNLMRVLPEYISHFTRQGYKFKALSI
jgi:peptidoglycan/xylan/chitin deacetylase (PgdA/CDA1 family)